MTFEWLGVVRDVLVIAYMFVVRIGVPLVLTWLIGAWLQQKLRATDAAEAARPAADGEACWDLKRCSETVRASCAAAQHPELPCWLALQISGAGLKQACYTCPLYVTGPGVPRVVPVALRRTGRRT